MGRTSYSPDWRTWTLVLVSMLLMPRLTQCSLLSLIPSSVKLFDSVSSK